MARDNMKHRRLQELGESDFEIVEGQPDIRGWDITTATSETIGEVDELILDAKERKVRYMVVDLDKKALDLEDDRKVLIPIGLAQLHEKDDEVLLPGVSISQLRQLPTYDSDHLDDAVERSISTVLGRSDVTSERSITDDASFYNHQHFNHTNLYQRRLLPQSTTAQKDNSGIGLQQKGGSMTKAEKGDMDILNQYDSSAGREDSYREQVEEERLQAVRNNRNNGDNGYNSNRQQEERDDRFLRGDFEDRNFDESTSRDQDI